MAQPKNMGWDQSGAALYHGASHAQDGADPLLPADIGAADTQSLQDLTDILTGLASIGGYDIEMLKSIGASLRSK